MSEILQCLKKYGQRLDLEIAKEMGVPLATVRQRLAGLAATGEIITCNLTRFEMARRSTRGSAACRVMSRLQPPAERQNRRRSRQPAVASRRTFDGVSVGVDSWLVAMTVITTTVYVRPDGPYIVTGDFALDARGAPRDDASVVLCRCGRSSNKPYCDGAHTHIGFIDAGVLPRERRAEWSARRRPPDDYPESRTVRWNARGR